MKGVSPLIAAVLLIAFTMAIAGILATWATTFSRQRLSIATTEGECLGALDVSSLNTYVEDVTNKIHITFKIRNVAPIDMSNFKGKIVKRKKPFFLKKKLL